MKEPNVIYEDNHLLGINKPAGWLVQADETGDFTLLDWAKAYIKQRYQKPGEVFMGVIHRLDRPVSGVVLFARTSKALSRMNELFAKRDVEKIYWAIVSERPDPLYGTLEHSLVKDESRNVTKALDVSSRRGKEGKVGILDYELSASINDKHLLEVRPLTGRPHQIRAQLSRIGCPIYNDLKYNGKQLGKDKGSIYLHSRELNFYHPVTKLPIHIEAELPDREDVWRLFKKF